MQVLDWHLNTTSGDFFEKTGPSAWTLRGNLKGPPGEGGGGPHTHAQADVTGLVAALAAKAANDHVHSYNDLTDKPAIPSATSQLANDSGFLTSAPVSSVAGKTGAVTLAKADVGLGNVDNTSDANKTVSAATQAALDGKQSSLGFTPENSANKAQPNGYASLGADGKVPSAQLPATSGGSDPWTYLRLPADCTISTAAAGDVTNGGILFGFTPAANTTYIWEAVLGLRTATATVNPRLGFAWATGMSDGICSIEQTSTATAKVMANGNIAAALLIAVGGVPNNSASWPAICYGSVRAGASPSGSCRIQLASETAGTIVRVAAAVSYFRYRALT
jgi:hypothetical protein